MIKKAIVKTVSDKNGDYMYIDTITGFVIESDRPVVAQVTTFLSQKIADGQIKLLTPNLPKEADDAEFANEFYAKFKDEKNGANAAIAAYASKFGLDESGNETGEEYVPPTPKKTKAELKAEKQAAEKAAEQEAEDKNKEEVKDNLLKAK